MTIQLHDLGRKIFLDRYALKDANRKDIKDGDTVIAIIDEINGQRELGVVVKVNESEVVVDLENGDQITRHISQIDVPLEKTPEETIARVARGAASVEKQSKQAEWQEKFKWLMDDFKFIPGGRILTMAGTDQQLTAFNCFVLPGFKDSRGGIFERLEQMAEIMSRGGGVGINVSALRPKHAYVKGVNGRSSGAVSWAELFSFTTNLIEQAGCFAGDTRIATDKGLIQIKELVNRIEKGEKFKAQTHKGLRDITDSFRNGIKKTYTLKTKRGYSVTLTDNHPVGILQDGEVRTMMMKYIQPSDKILLLLDTGTSTAEYVKLNPYTNNSSRARKMKTPTELNEELAYILGYSYADGYIDGTQKNSQKMFLSCADAHPSIKARLVKYIKNQFGYDAVVNKGDGALEEISIQSNHVIEWLKLNNICKQKAENVRVPESIFQSPSSVMLAFVAGYFDADCCRQIGKTGTKRSLFQIDSISLGMIEDLKKILAYHGILSDLEITDRTKDGGETIYRLSIAGNTWKNRFYELIPAEKITGYIRGNRDMYTVYPSSITKNYGIKPKHVKSIYDGQSENISIGQLPSISAKLIDYHEYEIAEKVETPKKTVIDTVISIEEDVEQETFDITVDDIHMINSNVIYSGNSRRGALMIILDDWHPDVFTFINYKRQAGRMTGANISVNISDKFMETLERDGDWDLMFPDTSDPQYDSLWNGNLQEWIDGGHSVIVRQTVKARKLWDEIIAGAWASAEPGIWFGERYQKMSNSYYYPEGSMVATNPCITGDTRIYTDKGLIKADDLYNSEAEFKVVVDGRFATEETTVPSSRVFRTGKKKVYKIQTKEGYFVRVTENHQIMTPAGWVEAKDLSKGDKLHILNHQGEFGLRGGIEEGRAIGRMMVAGWLSKGADHLNLLGAEKEEFASMFTGYANEIVAPMSESNFSRRNYTVEEHALKSNPEYIVVASERLEKLANAMGVYKENSHRIPEFVWQGTKDMQRGFLQTLFSADGAVLENKEKGISVRLSQSNLELLQEVQLILLNFGIFSKIYQNTRPAGIKMMPDSKTNLAFYVGKANHELVISKSNVYTFSNEIGFIIDSKQAALKTALGDLNRDIYSERFLATVESITQDGIEDVYDLTEPLTHSFIGSGIVLHNCGEQGLPGNGICNLGAINLSKFYNPETHDVDWESLRKATQYGVRFLDNIIDHTPYFSDAVAQQEKRERRVGLGTFGIAELLIRLGIRYGSDDSVRFLDKLYGFIAEQAYLTSADIAGEKGSFYFFDAEKFLDSGFMKTMPEHVRTAIREKGIRNVTLLTQAPTGTTSTMANSSGGIEPFFSWKFYRKSRLGLSEENVPLVQDWLDKNPDKTIADLPDYFVTAMELDPEGHVKVQAAIQRWVDSSISKTNNLPNNYTVEDVGKIYKMMYDLGCKGGTIYRDGSRNEQVLMTTDDNRVKEIKEAQTAAIKSINASSLPTANDAKVENEVKLSPYKIADRSEELQGKTVRVETAFGYAYITINSDSDGYPFEVFVSAPGKAGSDLQADAEGIGRLISLTLRSVPQYQRRDALREIASQMKDISGSSVKGFGSKRIASLPDAVAYAIIENYLNAPASVSVSKASVPVFPATISVRPASVNDYLSADPLSIKSSTFSEGVVEHKIGSNGNGNGTKAYVGVKESAGTKVKIVGAKLCPSCKNHSLVLEEGCKKCSVCGYSAC